MKVDKRQNKPNPFQSTHSRGVRPGSVKMTEPEPPISIHALTRSATYLRDVLRKGVAISIHALTRSATALVRSKGVKEAISIHALTRSATIHTDQTGTAHKFQSTHSRGVRLAKIEVKHGERLISIHALTRSATTRSANSSRFLYNFNPRTHEECDFLSLQLHHRQLYFNPRTHEECDQVIRRSMRKNSYFNPRTHEECDSRRNNNGHHHGRFQSTHSRGVRP